MADYLPGINVGAAWRRVTGDKSKGDEDILPWISKNGGARDFQYSSPAPGVVSFNGAVKPGWEANGRGGYTEVAATTQNPQNPNLPPRLVGAGGAGGGGGGGGGGGAAPKVLDEAQLRSLDSLLSSLDTVRNQSKEKARLKREEARTTKDREKEREDTKYKGKKVNVLQDFAGAKTDTDMNTRNTLENLMSSLSVMGLGGSRALTRQILSAANKSNRKANATQARDQQGLDSAWGEYESGYNDDVKKIEDQLGYDQGEADRIWGQNRQNYLHKKADVYNQADRTNERTALMSEADNLNGFIGAAPFMNPSYTGKSRAMETPELSDYQQDIGRYDTTAIGADAAGVVPVGAGVTPGATPGAGNLAIKAIAVNDKDLGIKKKTEGTDLVLGV